MSNFTGVTFAEQKVAPSDDAIIRRAILPDGILSGCELSYSGSTLTMAAGHLIVCGRQIRHPAAQNWAVVDATSGYARLVLTIDLSRTATENVFDQIVDSIEYATAEDGFTDLEQSDINNSGTRYQIAVCTVSLGTGGISGVVTQLEKSAVDGLNFKLVGGLIQPADPVENTIWINTVKKITGYSFSATEPTEAVDGMVWLIIGTTSNCPFNVLKNNSIIIHPINIKQYIDGNYVYKNAQIYMHGSWVDLLDLTPYFFKSGIGWVSDCDIELLQSCTMNSEVISIPSGNSGRHGFITKAPVTINGAKTLHIKLKHAGGISTSGYGFYIGFSDNTEIDWPPEYWTSYVRVSENYPDWTVVTLDISNGIDNKYMKMFSYVANPVEISDIWYTN